MFGARSEAGTKRRGVGALPLAAAALAAGLLFAGYGLLRPDSTDPDLVEIENIAAEAIDPLKEARGDTLEAALPEGGPAGKEVAALAPDATTPPEPRAADPLPAVESSVVAAPTAAVEAPQSDLATPIVLPRFVQTDVGPTPEAPAPPERREEAAVLEGLTPPPPPGTVFDMDERGLVRPTEDGALTPKGVIVHAGRPDTLPPAAATGGKRPASEEPAADKPTDTEDDATLDPPGDEPIAALTLPRIRPASRPVDMAAPAVTVLAADPDTPRPAPRPDSSPTKVAVALAADPDFDALARQARAQTSGAGAGIVATTPRAAEPPPPEPEGRANVAVKPSAPTSASVAERATVANAIRLNRINLIGVYGTASDRRALIRLPNGRYVKVKVGDRVDGGQVSAIQSSSVQYVKGGQRYALKLPNG